MADPDAEFLEHLRGLGVPDVPTEQRRAGLDRSTEEGALVAFAGSLRRDRPSHRFTAWVLLVAFALPALLALAHLAGMVFDYLAG